MREVHYIALTLLIIGGLNWGLVGLADIDLVAALFGDMTTMARIVYVLVGLSAIVVAYTGFARTRITGTLRTAH